ncbi:hypothetical protein ASPWEDRAFT_693082 [Aspergillus wentii DTO 134E9]|uniref:Uncharacterized protein n=1 Tax=Aspergillus wentii DTO 134E9 TaxID=1073089 RepID=A0A1L9R974_ASPWE|nr:uncharacterized protein ASPWEDRAFT_693082 [Aspergillus wentii DTO 134E9]OJJ31472.1 hypothetical protein ASPWEDRAFT_693082 [Aspergillus wentii DTO 134E9]
MHVSAVALLALAAGSAHAGQIKEETTIKTTAVPHTTEKVSHTTEKVPHTTVEPVKTHSQHQTFPSVTISSKTSHLTHTTSAKHTNPTSAAVVTSSHPVIPTSSAHASGHASSSGIASQSKTKTSSGSAAPSGTSAGSGPNGGGNIVNGAQPESPTSTGFVPSNPGAKISPEFGYISAVAGSLAWGVMLMA